MSCSCTSVINIQWRWDRTMCLKEIWIAVRQQTIKVSSKFRLPYRSCTIANASSGVSRNSQWEIICRRHLYSCYVVCICIAWCSKQSHSGEMVTPDKATVISGERLTPYIWHIRLSKVCGVSKKMVTYRQRIWHGMQLLQRWLLSSMEWDGFQCRLSQLQSLPQNCVNHDCLLHHPRCCMLGNQLQCLHFTLHINSESE